MTDKEKAYSVISRTGGTRHIAESMTPAETAELVKIYDEATDETLASMIGEFWTRRAERLAQLKAADEVQQPSVVQRPTLNRAEPAKDE